MIVRNEAQLIAEAIGSVRPAALEVIVVDTGSTDNTREIAAGLGARIVETPWEGDFSRARNLSLIEAAGDWILVIDADEVIDSRDLPALRFLTTKRSCYRLVQRHYVSSPHVTNFQPCRGEYPEREKNYCGYHESAVCRLFPNRLGIEFSGRIHEIVEPSIARDPTLHLETALIPLHHYGQTDELKRAKAKRTIYAELSGSKALDSASATANFEYALALYHAGEFEKAVSAFTRTLSLEPNYFEAWLNLGAVLLELGNLEASTAASTQAVLIAPQSTEAHGNLGAALLKMSHWQEAETHLKAALALSPGFIPGYYNLARTYFSQGEPGKAIELLEQAVESLPNIGLLWLELAATHIKINHPQKALSNLKIAETLGQSMERVLFLRGEVERMLGKKSEALQYFRRCEKICEAQSDQNLLAILRRKIAELVR